MAEEVRAGLVREEGVERLPVLREVHALAERVPHAELIGVEDELLVAHREPALEPAGGVENEVRAAEDGRLHRVRRLVCRLCVRDLRRGERPARAEGNTEPARERGHDVEDECRLGRAEGRRAGLHRHRARERSEHDRGSRPDELDVRHPRERLGERLRARSRNGRGAHRAGEDERGHHHRLIRLGVRARGAEHRRVPDERRVGVDEAEDHRVLLDEVLAEDDPCHVDRVARALRVRDRAHERLVREPQVRLDHVVVTLVHREVDRFADRSAGVVEPGRDVRELHEVPEVLDRPVASSVVEVAHERRPVRGREDRVLPTEDDAALGVSRDLRELARRRRLHELTAHATREAHALAVDLGTCVAEELDRIGRVAEVDPDPLEDRVGVLLERRQALVGENLEWRERAGEERHALDRRRRAVRPVGRRARRLVVLASRSCELPLSATPSRRPLVRCDPAAGKPDRPREPRVRIDVVRDRHRVDEELLEARLDRSLHLLDATHDVLDLGSRCPVEERDSRSGARGVARSGDAARGRSRERVRARARAPGRCASRTLPRAGCGRPSRSRTAPSAGRSPRRAPPWPAGSAARRSGVMTSSGSPAQRT